MTPFAAQILNEKYHRADESREEAVGRLALNLNDTQEFRDILWNQRFLPGGRVMRAIGAGADRLSAINCTVNRRIPDSIGGIMDVLKETAVSMSAGMGVGTDFSSLRPDGSPISGVQSTASGPVSFMPWFSQIGRTIRSAGGRMGAQMATLRCDHPDILKFVRAKRDNDSLTGFNISVLVTDELMRAVEEDLPFDLRWGGRIYDTLRARDLWDEIMESTWDWAEPGVIFLDTMNRMNPLSYGEELVTVNACSEIPLPAYGSCLLGSFNLTAYLSPFTFRGKTKWEFLWRKFRKDIPPVVNAMDNVIHQANHALPQQRRVHCFDRRMGLGVTGLANAGEALGFAYGSTAFLEFTEEVFRALQEEAYVASAERASRWGSFAPYDPDRHLDTPWGQSLTKRAREAVSRHGLRNSHLLAVAPTGTISLTVDKGPVSSGIEPVFAERYRRPVRIGNETQDTEIVDWGVTHGIKPRTADQVTVGGHLRVLAVAQKYCCSAVSKTVNVGEGTSYDEFREVYLKAWKAGAKSVSTFRSGGKRHGLLEVSGDSCRLDENGKRDCS